MDAHVVEDLNYVYNDEELRQLVKRCCSRDVYRNFLRAKRFTRVLSQTTVEARTTPNTVVPPVSSSLRSNWHQLEGRYGMVDLSRNLPHQNPLKILEFIHMIIRNYRFSARLGCVLYYDNEETTTFQRLSSNHSDVIEFLTDAPKIPSRRKADNQGNTFLKRLHKAIGDNWMRESRILYHIGDVPYQEREEYDSNEFELTRDIITKRLRDRKIKYVFQLFQ